MTDAQAPIDWYLARDGQQYGPLNEAEMRAFVDLGHLRESDLIWRPGFADWQPAPNVFAIHQVPPVSETSPPPPVFQPQPSTVPGAVSADHAIAADPPAEIAAAAATSTGTQSAPAAATPVAGAIGAATATVAQPHEPAAYPAAAAAMSEPASAGTLPQHPQDLLISPDQLLQPHHSAAVAAPAEPALQAPQAWTSAPSAAQPGASRKDGAAVRPRPAASRQAASPVRAADPPGRDQRAVVRPAVDDFEDDDQPRRRIGFGRIAAALVFALLVGVLMAGVIKGDKVTALLPKALSALMVTDGPAAPSAPGAAAIASPDAADQRFQRLAMWRQVKQDFPEWYSERVQEAVKLAAEKRTDAQINKQSAEALVALRRKHADQALTASPERLRYVAKAFLENLQALAKQNVETCYGFISQGETHPAILAMLQKPEGSDLLQAQIVAVFEAIADGRKAPQTYLPPRKADYDALAAELTARGWTENDMRVFSDPRALGRASPQDVCRMVQDWFAAQIAIKDPDTQVRLLVESLRPVVAG